MANKNTLKIYTEWLVLRCQDSDSEAFSELYSLWNNVFKHHVFKLSGSSEHTQDIVQDGWIAISRGLKGIKDPAMFSAWGYRIMTNKVRDWQRINIPREKLHTQKSDNELEQIPAEQKDENKTDIDTVRLAIEKLNTEQRALIMYFYFKEMKIHEISKLLNLAPGTVKSRLFTARKQLKKIMERM